MFGGMLFYVGERRDLDGFGTIDRLYFGTLFGVDSCSLGDWGVIEEYPQGAQLADPLCAVGLRRGGRLFLSGFDGRRRGAGRFGGRCGGAGASAFETSRSEGVSHGLVDGGFEPGGS